VFTIGPVATAVAVGFACVGAADQETMTSDNASDQPKLRWPERISMTVPTVAELDSFFSTRMGSSIETDRRRVPGFTS
jgi:hypothetical protein